MIVGERNLNDSLGAGMGLEGSIGKAEFKKSTEMNRRYNHHDTISLDLGLGTGFRLNRFSMGVQGFRTITNYSKYQKSAEGENSQKLESFKSVSETGIVSMSYIPTIKADWTSHSFSVRYQFIDKIKYKDFSDNSSVSYSSNHYQLRYFLGLRNLYINTGLDFNIRNGELDEQGHILGIGLCENNFSIGFNSTLKNYENRLIIRSNIVYFRYGFNFFDISI